ncbi:hypothetical protein BC834DRAFT_844918 [Gloeopeniophorella convolvens]|nr:hypothetical protein BC834DRAFT_844918 [Gloeopeniophorella convolvens]
MASAEEVTPVPASVEEPSASAPAEKTSNATSTSAAVPEDGVSTKDDVEPPEVQALKQIEFYFADANLPYDKFMWTLHTANEEHWVPISTVASFKRMRDFQAHGIEWLANALRASTDIEVSDDGTKVRRRTEVQEPKGAFDRSVYAKGFGEEIPGLQKTLEQFFSKYGKVAAVRMRRVDGTKAFKGSVFAEFAEFKSVEAFLNAEPKPSWDDKELLIMSKEAYVEMKIKEKGLKGKAAVVKRDHITRKGFDAFREMRLAAEGKGKGGAKVADKTSAKPEVFVDFLGTKIRVLDADGGSVAPDDVPHVRGASLRFVGCGGEASFDDIKRPLKERFTRVPFVKYSKGNDAGLVGFDKALNEEDITFVREKIPTLNGKPVTWELPGEEEERTFELERANSAARRALGGSEAGSRGGRGGRGGRGARGGRGGRGRGRGGRSGQNRDRAEKDGDEQTGEKRKRAVEPDGGHDAGVRGQTVPTIASASKKAKTDGVAS